MALRFMGPSGLADPEWPDSARFNSSIKFSTERHSDDGSGNFTVASCVGTWPERAGLDGWNGCAVNGSHEQVHWRFAPGAFENETHFRLEMLSSAADST